MKLFPDMEASAEQAARTMPKGWIWERFKIVNAGNGQIALHSKVHNRFVRMNKNGRMDTSPGKRSKLPRGWAWERFTVVKAGNGEIALHSKVHNRFVRMNNRADMDAGPRRSVRHLPRGWTWERFTVLQFDRRKRRGARRKRRSGRGRGRRGRRRGFRRVSRLQPGRTVALYCKVHKRFVRIKLFPDMEASARQNWWTMPKGWI